MSEISEETKQYMTYGFTKNHIVTIVTAYAGSSQSDPEKIEKLFIRLCDLIVSKLAPEEQ